MRNRSVLRVGAADGGNWRREDVEGLDYFPRHEWIVESEQFATG